MPLGMDRRQHTTAVPDRGGAGSIEDVIERRQTATVDVGGVLIGSGQPIVVQSMTNTDTADAPGNGQRNQ
jgi:hypothetical protein